MAANKDGIRFHIETFHPGTRPTQKKELSFDGCITRSYCFESVPQKNSSKVRLKNWVYSDATSHTSVPYEVTTSEIEAVPWRCGFWNEVSWRKGPLTLGENNEITRKHQVQFTPGTATTSVQVRARDFASVVARDEARLAKAKQRQRQKRLQSSSSSS